MFAAKIVYADGRSCSRVSAIGRDGVIRTGFDVRVWKTASGMAAAVIRATECRANHGLAGLMETYRCDENGREVR